MSARDRYSYKVKCAECGEEGKFHVSEDDYPFMRNPHRTVDSIEGNFSASVERGVEVNAKCLGCGNTFRA